MRRGFRCSRTWRTWSRAARSRPRAHPRSTAFIAWRGLSVLRVALLAFLDLDRFLRRDRIHHGADRVGQRHVALRVGAEIMPAVARGGADIDASAVRVGPDAHHHVVAEAEDRR